MILTKSTIGSIERQLEFWWHRSKGIETREMSRLFVAWKLSQLAAQGVTGRMKMAEVSVSGIDASSFSILL